MTATDFEAARRDPHTASARFSVAASWDGADAREPLEVATILHAIFPNLRFSLEDVEDDGIGGWIVPVPRTIGLIIEHGSSFAWIEEGFGHTPDVGIAIESSL